MMIITDRMTMAAFFTIAIASSFLSVGAIVDCAFAAKKAADNTLSNAMVQSKGGDSTGDAGKTNNVNAKGLEALLRCESDAAANGDLKLSEIRDCYLWAFTLY